MRLSAVAITNFYSVNMFTTDDQWAIRSGEPNTLYFQLVDLDNTDCDGKNPRRFVPLSTVTTMSVTFPSINSGSAITVSASQDSTDKSIWSISLTNVQVPASGNVLFSITQDSVTRTFGVGNFITVEIPGNEGSC